MGTKCSRVREECALRAWDSCSSLASIGESSKIHYTAASLIRLRPENNQRINVAGDEQSLGDSSEVLTKQQHATCSSERERDSLEIERQSGGMIKMHPESMAFMLAAGVSDINGWQIGGDQRYRVQIDAERAYKANSGRSVSCPEARIGLSSHVFHSGVTGVACGTLLTLIEPCSSRASYGSSPRR